ncbi:hypothetical protein GIB67_041629, partial [Kingdonia uniflora]
EKHQHIDKECSLVGCPWRIVAHVVIVGVDPTDMCHSVALGNDFYKVAIHDIVDDARQLWASGYFLETGGTNKRKHVGTDYIVYGVPNSGKNEWIDALLCNINENVGWKFVLCSMENQELWVLQWVAGIEMHYVQGYREGAISSEKLHLEKVSRLKNAIDVVYPKLQAQHNELDDKFFEERTALEAKYHKLYVPFYAKVSWLVLFIMG